MPRWEELQRHTVVGSCRGVCVCVCVCVRVCAPAFDVCICMSVTSVFLGDRYKLGTAESVQCRHNDATISNLIVPDF